MGQVKKTQQQIQNELDEMHHLISQGASDEYIMKNRNIDRRTFYRYKKRLYKQVAKQYEDKRIEDYYYDVQICKERLTHDRVNAAAKANETGNPIWGQLASELAISLLRLEAEGIKAITNGFKQLEAQARPLRYDESTITIPAPSTESTAATTTNDERQF